MPSVRNSAEIVQHGRITRRGSRSLRWILTECVHSHVRYAGDSYITNCYNRIAKKRDKGKAAMYTLRSSGMEPRVDFMRN